MKARLLLLVLMAQAAHATVPIDSLKALLAKTSIDSTRLQLMDAIMESTSDVSEIEKYSLEMKAICLVHTKDQPTEETKSYFHYQAVAANNLAYVAEQRDPEQSTKLYQESLDMFAAIDDKAGQAMALNNLGYVAKTRGQFNQAIEHYTRCLTLRRETKDLKGEAIAQNNIGRIFFELGDMPKALEYYRLALKNHKAADNPNGIAAAMTNISSVYFELKEYPIYIDYVKQTVDYAMKSGNQERIVNALDRLALAYRITKDFPKALETEKQALPLARKTNNTALIALSVQGIGETYRGMKELGKAIPYLTEALSLFEKMNEKIKIIDLHYSLGMAYESFSPTKAKQHYEIGLRISKEIKSLGMISNGAENLYKLYHKAGDAKAALQMFTLHVQMRDSLLNEDSHRAALKSQYRYEFEKKALADSIEQVEHEKVLMAELNQSKTERYLLVTGLALVTVAAMLVFYFIQTRQKIQELQFRNKIASDLHDGVGSALSSISIFSTVAHRKVPTEDNDTRVALEKIGEISRSILDDMSDIVWAISPRNDTFSSLKDRIDSFGHTLLTESGIEFRFDVDDAILQMKLTMTQRKNLFLILKEALNNIVKYSGASKAGITMKLSNKTIDVEISDNGTGFDFNLVKKGNGLENMRQRAEEMKAKFVLSPIVNQGTSIQLQF